MKKLILLILCLYAPALLLAQLHGTVKEAPSGRPLAGATVKLKHSGLSAVTDSAGRFRLEAPGADTLLVSFVGYQHLALPVRPPFNTALELVLTSDQRELEEVTVSTGYQQLPRERATGSFDQVGAQLLNREVGSNILARLDGIASGLLFDKRGNAVSNISVRGLSTLSVGIKNPLIVLDNFPYQGDVNNINPQDVESVTVLKDAAAASIWGVSAGNGVIVITTKKGRLNQAMRISVTSAVTVSAKPDIFNTRPIATSDFIDAEQFLLGKGFYNSVLNNKTSRLVVSPVVELLAAARSGAISAEEAGSRIDALRGLDVRNDFEKYVYRKAVNQQHSIGVSGGSVNSTYQVSVGYDQNLQGLAGNRYDRVTVRDANTFRPLPGLDIQTAIQYTRSRTVSNSSGGYGTLATGGGKTALYPYAQLADAAGNPLAIPRDHRFSYIDTAGQGRLLDWRYRPLAETALADNRTRLNDLLLNLGARYRLLPFLSAEVKYQFENSQNSGRNYYSPETYFTRNLVNDFTQVAGDAVTYAVPNGGILDQAETHLVSQAVRGQLELERAWGGRHRLDAIFGGEVRQAVTDLGSYRNYGYDDQTLTSQPVDQVNYYPVYGNLAFPSPIPYVNQQGGLVNRNVSLYGNAAYSYLGRYTLSLSARKDANNLFGVETNRKWVPLWSAGSAWLLSSEPFYHLGFLPYLKLRLTYGFSGNVNNSISALTTIQYFTPDSDDSLNGLPLAVISNYPNPQLRWEKIGTLNLGLDFSAFADRLSGSIDYYYKNARDLIGLVPADPTYGTSSVLQYNSAILHDYGVDVVLNSRNTTGAVQWNSALLFSINRNKVARYLYQPANYASYITNGGNISPVPGQPAYSVISYKWAGLDPANGNPRVYLNGQVSQDYSAIVNSVQQSDLVYSGSAVPQVYGSLRNDLTFRGFTFSFNLSYRFDYFFRRAATGYYALFNTWTGYSDFSRRWQKPGDELQTEVPSMLYPANRNRDAVYTNSNITVEKGDNIRLQDLRLAYRFRLGPGSSFRGLQLYAYASNLGILWRANKLGLDPDYGNALPAPRTISLGFQLDL